MARLCLADSALLVPAEPNGDRQAEIVAAHGNHRPLPCQRRGVLCSTSRRLRYSVSSISPRANRQASTCSGVS